MRDLSRRLLLGALATAPALALPAMARDVPARNIEASAEDRAKAAYAAFTLAMDEVAAGHHGSHGWYLMGGRREGFGTLPPSRYATAAIVRLCGSDDPRCPSLVFEKQEYLYDLKLV